MTPEVTITAHTWRSWYSTFQHMTARYRFEQALAKRFPDAYEAARRGGDTTPTAAELSTARFLTYRRLTIVKWGDGEEDGFPMVLDNTDDARQVWKISMQQWHETNGSSVGDPLLLSGWGARSTDMIAKEMLEGKFKTLEEVQQAYMRHFGALADEAKKQDAPATHPDHP